MKQGSQNLKVDNTLKKKHPRRDLSIRFLYLKTFLAIVVGLCLGYFNVTGVLGFMVFVPLQYIMCRIYCASFKIPDYIMDRLEMFTEQTLPSFGVFLLVWTVTYTLKHA